MVELYKKLGEYGIWMEVRPDVYRQIYRFIFSKYYKHHSVELSMEFLESEPEYVEQTLIRFVRRFNMATFDDDILCGRRNER